MKRRKPDYQSFAEQKELLRRLVSLKELVAAPPKRKGALPAWEVLVQKAVSDTYFSLWPDYYSDALRLDAANLLVFLIELKDAVATDPGDKQGRIELARLELGDVIRRLEEEVQQTIIEDPTEAFAYIVKLLSAEIAPSELAEILGVSTHLLNSWRRGKRVLRYGQRVTGLAYIVSYLSGSMTGAGIVGWFRTNQIALGGRTPKQVLQGFSMRHYTDLMALARGSATQIAG